MSQHIGLIKIDSQFKTIEKFDGNFVELLDKLKHLNAGDLVNSIDEYDSTIFNKKQSSTLLNVITNSRVGEDEQSETLIKAIKNQDYHEFLVFIGD